MASIELSLSAKEDKITHRSEILIRFVPFRGANLRVKSGMFIAPKHFRYFINFNKTIAKGIIVPDKVVSVNKEEAEKKGYEIKSYGEIVVTERISSLEVEHSKEQKKNIDELLALIMSEFSKAHKDDVNAVWLDKIVNHYHHPTKQPSKSERRGRRRVSIYDIAEEYLEKKRFSYDHTKAFRVLVRDMARYEAFKNKVLREKFTWNIDNITRKDIEDFENYLRNEKTLSEKYPKQFESILEQYPVEINVVHTFTKLQNRGEDGTPFPVDRKTQEPQWISNPFLCILGGIQPRAIANAFKPSWADEGFVQRWLYVYPQVLPEKEYKDNVLDETYKTAWYEMTDKLSAIGDMKLMLSPEAKVLLTEFNKETGRKERDADPWVASVLSKIRIQVEKWCAITHILSCGENAGAGQYFALPTSTIISEEEMRYSIECMRYFEDCGYRMLQQMKGYSSNELTKAQLIAELVKRTERQKLNIQKLADAIGVSRQYVSKIINQDSELRSCACGMSQQSDNESVIM